MTVVMKKHKEMLINTIMSIIFITIYILGCATNTVQVERHSVTNVVSEKNRTLVKNIISDNIYNILAEVEKYSEAKTVLKNKHEILRKMGELSEKAIYLFEEYSNGNISEGNFYIKMQEMQPKVRELYLKAGTRPFPPEYYDDYVQACDQLYADIDDMFLFYSKEGLENWPKSNRDYLMQRTIKRFYDDLVNLAYEARNIQR